MGMLILVLILVAVAALGIGLAFYFGVFRLEKLPAKGGVGVVESPLYPDGPTEYDENDEYDEYGEFDEYGDPDGLNPLGEEKPVSPFDYFADDDDEAEPAQQQGQNSAPSGDGASHQSRKNEEVFDKLCNLKIGRGFLQDCQDFLDKAKAGGQMCAAAYFDLDRFRYINSLKGQSIGDYVLSKLAQEIQEVFPMNSEYTRISADHFAVVFPLVDTDAFEEYTAGIKRICEKIRDHIGAKSNIRICVGFALTENLENDYNVEVLIQKANLARHCIKTSKVDSAVVFDDSMASTQLYGESAMEDYGENQYGEEFVLYFQPQCDLSTGKIISTESMVVWACEDYPDMYRELDSDRGRIPTNTNKVLYHSCRAMNKWRKAGKMALPTMVSLPANEFFKVELDKLLERCANDSQLEPDLVTICVELSTVQLSWPVTAKQMRSIKELGVRTCVENIPPNFQLGNLSGLPVDYIKFRPETVDNLENDPEQQNNVKQLLQQLSALEARAIFTGVDDQETAMLLRDLGATNSIVQGRYAGRPTSAEDLIQELPEYVEMPKPVRRSETVILDDETLAKGEFLV